MKRKDGELYYKISEISTLLKICPATLFNLIQIDRKMKEEGMEGFLPNATRINNIQHYKQSEVKAIRDGIGKLRKGDLLKYRAKVTTYQKLKKENEELKKKLAELEGGLKK
ncbi:hypothetical protein [Metabacillus bambusae]|uniref:Helix-turn-helix domain-containing protein n=1 Tax=Metabacillus bambusae TaxID=2795218 RepID=A0ABS3N624_9BACI|nr:hypothetical protein [Metabacillus bambusae]MBO1513521.1 hypothetical protein [Metabacillus bambusae]